LIYRLNQPFLRKLYLAPICSDVYSKRG
jgi:hypothetical protein